MKAYKGSYACRSAGSTPNAGRWRDTLFAGVLGSGLLLTTIGETAPVNVLTYHNDISRTGANPNETILTHANVTPAQFGKIFSQPVDGYIYPQPLVVTGLNLPGKGVHDVVFVATEHNSVYAFDANDNTGANASPLWQVNLGPSVSSGDVGSGDVVPEIGIMSTPVIDPQAGILYVVAKTKENGSYVQRLHAMDIFSGSEQLGGPVEIGATISGTGDGSFNGQLSFDPLRQMNRPGLLLTAGTVYIAFASHGDVTPYHGWVFGYDAGSLKLVSVFCSTPNGLTDPSGYPIGGGGIWQAGGGIACDPDGKLYVITGNGTFDADPSFGGGIDYGDSFVKLDPAKGLGVADYFTPYNQDFLNRSDSDLGSSGALLLPDSAGSAQHPHLLVGAGKEGKIYVLDRDKMGRFNAGGDNQIVQSVPFATGGAFGSPAFFNGTLYYSGEFDSLRAFRIANGQIDPPYAVSQAVDFFGFPGATPSVSANGVIDGIVWVLDNSGYAGHTATILHAYDAADLSNRLYSTVMVAGRDTLGAAVKFTTPTVANGKVYVGTQTELDILGLASFPPHPQITLMQDTAVEPAGTSHTVRAQVTDTVGIPRPGATVRFEIVAGPNAGLNSDINGCTNFGCQADFNGNVYWSYKSNGQIGTDQIQACTPDPQTFVPQCAQISVDWVTPPVSFNYPDFSSLAGLNLIGSAKQSGNILRLTPADFGQGGAAWATFRQPVGDGFDTTFQFQITDLLDTGADGFAFVIQNATQSFNGGGGASALGGGGGELGYFGIPNSLAVEFDTWFNPEWNDPNENHVSIHTIGDQFNSTDEFFSLGSTTAIPDLSDGNVHTVRISYTPGTLQVFLDDLSNPILSVPADLGAILYLDHGHAWLGFTAATGGAAENHDILNWSYTRTLREICDDGLDNDANGLIDAQDPACQALRPYQVSLTPSTGSSLLNQPYKVTARVTDAVGNPQPGVYVWFEAFGPNFVTSGQQGGGHNLGCFPSDCRTDANGEVQWKYFGGGNVGTDFIMARAYDAATRSQMGASATKDWQAPPAPVGNGDGLLGVYYDNIDFTGPTVTRIDPQIAFDWGDGSPDSTIGPDTFSVRWTGEVQAQFSEYYTFWALTDDGFRLWVDNQLIIDGFIDQPPTFYAGSIPLVASHKYKIRIDYYENSGGAVAQLFWTSPSTPFQIVPQTQLYSSYPDAQASSSIGLHFGADEPPGVGSALASSDVAGVFQQSNWNNLSGNVGSAAGLVSDAHGTPSSTSVSVTWSSPNTWSSTGRGEENNGFFGPERTLMSGYLDTTDNTAGQATVTISGLGPEFTAAGFDVIVYCLGGVGGRGGAYTIDSTTKFGSAPFFPSVQDEDPGIDLNDTGTYLRFSDLHHSSFTLTANADATLFPGLVNFRAPINGLQIVARPVLGFADCQVPAQSLLSGAAHVADDGSGAKNCVMHLTDANQCASNGVWTILDQAAGQNVNHIHVHWRSLVGGDDGSVCTATQFGRPGADGYSFNWGTDLATSFVGEEGTGSGVTVTVDTWDNGGGEAPGLEIKWQGQRVAFDPINLDQGLAKDFLRKNKFVDADLYVDAQGLATFIYDGRILQATLTDWKGLARGNYVFGARTGGASDNHWVDDVIINTQPQADSCPVASASNVSVNYNGKVDFQLVASDPEGDALTYIITQLPSHGTATVQPDTGEVVYSPDPGYCAGDSFAFSVSDGTCLSPSAIVSITVVDTEPPKISNLLADKNSLWPVDHKLKDVTVNYQATDNCTPQPTCSLSVSSNQPVNGTGDGNTQPDWQVIDAHHVRLRAERSGTDRVYTIVVNCLDDAGNRASASVTVVVPHNQAGANK